MNKDSLFYNRGPSQAPSCIVLSIQRRHADRIFSGEKKYELRTALPNQEFSRVYLHETGGVGIIGYFDISEILNKDIDELWEEVGTDAAPKDRFFEYFSKWKNGYAIEVNSPVEFGRPLTTHRLKTSVSDYRPPQSSTYVEKESTLAELLENKRLAEANKKNFCRLSLRSISKDEWDLYTRMCVDYIGKNYDDIDENFAQRNLKVHDQGYDPSGFMTLEKEILSIEKEFGNVIGFITLTYKRGGSVKSGPTLLLEEYQGQEYGQLLRRKIEEYVKLRGCRKIYCTCPTVSSNVIRYLLKSDYKIEANLVRHYNKEHDELVFGKMLADPQNVWDPPSWPKSSNPGQPIALRRYNGDADASKSIQSLFNNCLVKVKQDYAERLVREVHQDSTGRDAKSKDIIMLKSGNGFNGCIISLPKRGGAVKSHLLRSTAHTPSISRLIEHNEDYFRGKDFRKIYYLHPASDREVISSLKQRGYSNEGALRSPYVSGRDFSVLGKIF